jgi:chromosomal replication initiator protein
MQATALKKTAIVATAENIKSAMAAKMDSAAFASWIAPLAVSVNGDCLELVAPNQFSADFIRRALMNAIDSVAADFSLSVKLSVRGAAVAPSAVNDNRAAFFTPSAAAAAPVASFDNFICADENLFAVSAAKKLVGTPTAAAGAGASISPLFIYGPAGCGKSLLADCIGSSARGRTVALSGAQFVSDFLRSLNEKSVFSFKDYCRNCDTFILDDLNALAGKKACGEEFLSLIVDLIKDGKNVVLTANAAPAGLGGFERRALSVFASGLAVDLSAPNKSVRAQMLIRAGVPNDVAESISGRIAADGHLVAGIAKKIKTYSELMSEKITTCVAEKLLSDLVQKNRTPLVMVKTMCEKLGVSYDEVCGAGRTRTIVRARQIMFAALKTGTSLSLAEIGRLVGDRDHATVLYGLAQIEKAKQSDLILAAEIAQMVEVCR